MMHRLATALALLVFAAVGVAGCGGDPQSPQATAPNSSHQTTAAPRQTVLPFAGLEKPHDVAVDTAGNVYVADTQEAKEDNGFPAGSRVIKLAAGSNTQATLPQFVHASLVADPAGGVWVDDEQLVKLAAGSDTETVLPAPDLGMHGDVLAMDVAGNVYGVNGGGVHPGGGCCVTVQVVKVAAVSDVPTVLPFEDIDAAGGMAVDTVGSLYVGDGTTDRVLKLAAGATEPTVLPFNHIDGLVDVAVDSSGNVYAVGTNDKRVLKLAPKSDTPTVLPFSGLNHPLGVAVDAAGNVYVVDGGNRSVVKLAAEQS